MADNFLTVYKGLGIKGMSSAPSSPQDGDIYYNTTDTKFYFRENSAWREIDPSEVARSIIAAGTADHVLINDGSGNMSSEATLAKSRGGTGADNSSVTFPSSGKVTAVASPTDRRVPRFSGTDGIVVDSDIASNADSIQSLQDKIIIGDSSATDKIIEASQSATSPKLKYNNSLSKWQFSNNGSYFYDMPTSSGGGMTREVTQSTHGFAVLEPIYYNNTSDEWTSARADADATLATHIVTGVIDTNNFTCASGGSFTISSHGKAEGLWYVSKTTAGEVTQTAPTSGYDNIAFQVIDANNIEVITYYRPSLVTAGGASLWTAFGKFNGSGFEDGVNCTHSVVSTKSRLDFGTNEYPTGLNSGNPSGGALSVYIDGKRIPRYHDGSLVDTSGAYYKEISATVIELDQDYSSETVTIEVEYDVLITDSGTDHGTRITDLEGDTVDLTTTQTVGGNKTFTGDNEFAGELKVRGIGENALDSLTTGTDNTAHGTNALTACTEGIRNTAMGADALAANTTADNNTAIGDSALESNTTGASNTAVGRAALFSNQTGSNNVAMGVGALLVNTASNNIAVGNSALTANTSGGNNTAVGYETLKTNTTASFNTAIGYKALEDNTSGASNTAVGVLSLTNNTSGGSNTAVGYETLEANSTGDNNTAFGRQALEANTSGTRNTAVGRGALTANTNGIWNTAVGYNAFATGTSFTNSTCIGYESSADASKR